MVSVSMRTDTRGAIPSTIVWPQMGINDLESRELLTYEEASKKWKNLAVVLTVSNQKKEIHRAEISLSDNKKKPLVFASTEKGRPINAIEGHKDALFGCKFSDRCCSGTVPRISCTTAPTGTPATHLHLLFPGEINL